MKTDIYVNNLHLGDFASFSINKSRIELREGNFVDYKFCSWIQADGNLNYDIDLEVASAFGPNRFHLRGGSIRDCQMTSTGVRKLVLDVDEIVKL